MKLGADVGTSCLLSSSPLPPLSSSPLPLPSLLTRAHHIGRSYMPASARAKTSRHLSEIPTVGFNSRNSVVQVEMQKEKAAYGSIISWELVAILLGAPLVLIGVLYYFGM